MKGSDASKVPSKPPLRARSKPPMVTQWFPKTETRVLCSCAGLIPWLAGIDPETGNPRRRVARASEIPAEALTLIDKLVEVRLLSADRVVRHDDLTGARIVERTIEPAHDILLRQWGLLKGWLSEDLAALTVLRSVKRAASEWAANQMNKVWLAHRGGRCRMPSAKPPIPSFELILTPVIAPT